MRFKSSFFLFILAAAIARFDVSLVGFSIVLLYAVSIIVFGGGFKSLKPGRELGFLLFGSQVLFFIFLCFEGEFNGVVSYMSHIFDSYFSKVFIGIQITSRDLYLDGYIERSRSIKGCVVIAFILALLFSWRYIVACIEYRPTKPRRQHSSKWQASMPYLILVPMLIFLILGVDMYSPTCRSRCSGIQYSNFMSMNWLMAMMAGLSALVGMWLSTLFNHYNFKNVTEKELQR